MRSAFAVHGFILHWGSSRDLFEGFGKIVGRIEGEGCGNVADGGFSLSEHLLRGVDLQLQEVGHDGVPRRLLELAKEVGFGVGKVFRHVVDGDLRMYVCL